MRKLFILLGLLLTLSLSGQDPFMMVVASQGVSVDNSATFTVTGTGTFATTTTFRVNVSAATVFTLSSNAHFYSDAAGTANESATWSPTTGSIQLRYVKCGSGTATLTIDEKDNLTQWGYAGNNGWQTQTNSPTISGDISQLTASLTTFNVSGGTAGGGITGSIEGLTGLTLLQAQGTTTISGSIEGLTGLTYLNITGTNTVSGSLTSLSSLTYINVGGASTITGDVTLLTGLTYLSAASSSSSCNIGGSITNLTSLTGLTATSPVVGVISGDISNLTGLTQLYNTTSTWTISGDLGTNNVIDGITGIATLRLSSSQMTTYTGNGTPEDVSIIITPNAGYGLTVASITALLIDCDESGTPPTSKTITLNGNNASMADTADPGIWGTFSGVDTPSALATACKSLVRTRTNTVSLTGITWPGGTGDGTGFPAGFGDWWRL